MSPICSSLIFRLSLVTTCLNVVFKVLKAYQLSPVLTSQLLTSPRCGWWSRSYLGQTSWRPPLFPRLWPEQWNSIFPEIFQTSIGQTDLHLVTDHIHELLELHHATAVRVGCLDHFLENNKMLRLDRLSSSWLLTTSNWSSEGAIPMVFITDPNSYNKDDIVRPVLRYLTIFIALAEIVPSPSLSNRLKAFLISFILAAENLESILLFPGDWLVRTNWQGHLD